MSGTLFFDLTFNKKKRVNTKKQIALFFSSNNDRQTILDKEPKIEICPSCSYKVKTIETPDRCPNCEWQLA